MKLQIKVDPATGKITKAVFKTFGCGSASEFPFAMSLTIPHRLLINCSPVASSSYMTELISGMTLEEAAKVKNTHIAQELCLPPVKLHCSMLAEDAIKSALNNYYTKNPNAKPTNLAGTEAKMPAVEATA